MNKITAPTKRKIFKQDDWYVFYDPVNVRWVKVNESGKEIIRAVEESPTLENAVQQLKQKYQCEDDKIYPFIEYLTDNAHYLHKGQYQKRELDFNRGLPAVLYLHPTYDCNLDCVYCYNKDDRNKHKKNRGFSPLTLQDYESLFKDMKELGITGLVFSGGEPLLRKDIFEIAKISKGLGLNNAIVTNGTLISPENAGEIIHHFHQVSVSIDSCKEEENDVMRGKGSFRKALKGIHALRSLGANVSCLGVAHKGSLDNMKATWDYFVNQLGCTSFLPQLFIPAHEKLNTEKEIEDFVMKYSRIRDEINMLNKIYSQVQIKNNCGMCAGELAIGADGGVFPCQSLLKEEFRCGSIKSDSLKNILENSPMFKKLREFSVDDIETCCDCDIKYLCSGGCRAFHYEIYKDLKKTDTRFCPINRTVITRALFESAVHSSREVPGKETTPTKIEPTCL